MTDFSVPQAGGIEDNVFNMGTDAVGAALAPETAGLSALLPFALSALGNGGSGNAQAPQTGGGGSIAPSVQHYGPFGLLTSHTAGLAAQAPAPVYPNTLQFGPLPQAPQASIAPMQSMSTTPTPSGPIIGGGGAVPMMPAMNNSPVPTAVMPAMNPGAGPMPAQQPYLPQQAQQPQSPFIAPYNPQADNNFPQPPPQYQSPAAPAGPQMSPWQQSAANQLTGLSGQPASAIPAMINSGSGILGNAVQQGGQAGIGSALNFSAFPLTAGQAEEQRILASVPPPPGSGVSFANTPQQAQQTAPSQQPVATQAQLLQQAGDQFAANEAALVGSETGNINTMSQYLTKAQKRVDDAADLAKNYLLNRANVDFKHKVGRPDTWVNTAYNPETKKIEINPNTGQPDTKPRLLSKLQAYTALTQELEGFKNMNYEAAGAMGRVQPKNEDYLGDAMARTTRHGRGGLFGLVNKAMFGSSGGAAPTATQVNDMAEEMQMQSVGRQQAYIADINAQAQQNLPVVEKQIEGLAKTIDDAYSQRKADIALAHATSAGIVNSFSQRVQPFVELAKSHSQFLGADLAATKEVSAGSRQAAASQATFDAAMAKVGLEGQKASEENRTKKEIAGLDMMTKLIDKGNMDYPTALKNTLQAVNAFDTGELPSLEKK